MLICVTCMQGRTNVANEGKPTQYDGKVDWKNLDLSTWEYIGTDDTKYEYLEIYTQVLNAPRFKRKLSLSDGRQH